MSVVATTTASPLLLTPSAISKIKELLNEEKTTPSSCCESM